MRRVLLSLVQSWAFAGILVASTFAAKPPDWAGPVLSQDVSELGRGFDAVVLADMGRVEYTADHRQRYTYRGALRVLTEPSRARARCRHYYNADTERIVSAHAWIVSADGTHTSPFSLREFTDNAAQYGDTFWPTQRLLAFSGADRIEVGGTLIWEYELESQVSMFDHTWTFPYDEPTLVCTFDVAPPSGGTLVWNASSDAVPAPVAGATVGSLHWEQRNYRPPLESETPDDFLPTSRFVSVRANVPGAPDIVNSWRDVARLTGAVMEPPIGSVSAELTAKAAELSVSCSDRWQRVRTISEFVQKEITYLSVTLDKDCLAGYRPHPAQEVLKNRFGDCKDKATLLLAMLRAVGVECWPVLVFSGNPTAVRPEWPSLRFNHAIVALAADDTVPAGWPVVQMAGGQHVVLFDPTNSDVPLGVLPSEDQGGFGLVVRAETSDLVRLPSREDAYDCDITATLAADGTISASARETATGNLGAVEYGTKQAGTSRSFAAALDARLHESIPITNNLHWKDAWDPVRAEWTLKLDFNGIRYGRLTGTLMLVDPLLMAAYPSLTRWQSTLDGVVWFTAATYSHHVRIKLPPSAVIEELPEPWRTETPEGAASVSYRRDGGAVVTEITVKPAGGFLNRDGYERTRQLLLQTQQAGHRPLVLRRPSA